MNDRSWPSAWSTVRSAVSRSRAGLPAVVRTLSATARSPRTPIAFNAPGAYGTVNSALNCCSQPRGSPEVRLGLRSTLNPSSRLTSWTSLKILNKGITEQHAQQQQAGYDHCQIPEPQREGNTQDRWGVAVKAY